MCPPNHWEVGILASIRVCQPGKDRRVFHSSERKVMLPAHRGETTREDGDPVMKSFDFEAVVCDGAVYCVDWCPVDVESEDVAPIFADEEWDYAPVCYTGGRVHDYVTLLEEPEPDDLVLSSTGPLGSRTLLSVVDGPVLGEYSTEEEALQAARDYCQR